jgi:hypothetical protein
MAKTKRLDWIPWMRYYNDWAAYLLIDGVDYHLAIDTKNNELYIVNLTSSGYEKYSVKPHKARAKALQVMNRKLKGIHNELPLE